MRRNALLHGVDEVAALLCLVFGDGLGQKETLLLDVVLESCCGSLVVTSLSGGGGGGY